MEKQKDIYKQIEKTKINKLLNKTYLYKLEKEGYYTLQKIELTEKLINESNALTQELNSLTALIKQKSSKDTWEINNLYNQIKESETKANSYSKKIDKLKEALKSDLDE